MSIPNKLYFLTGPFGISNKVTLLCRLNYINLMHFQNIKSNIPQSIGAKVLASIVQKPYKNDLGT